MVYKIFEEQSLAFLIKCCNAIQELEYFCCFQICIQTPIIMIAKIFFIAQLWLWNFKLSNSVICTEGLINAWKLCIISIHMMSCYTKWYPLLLKKMYIIEWIWCYWITYIKHLWLCTSALKVSVVETGKNCKIKVCVLFKLCIPCESSLVRKNLDSTAPEVCLQ